ncbi:FAD-dependent oxidoreductase [Microlunatus sp. GCM10028923]|uniref:FAD-dependent oxidoreductase n=1 Tax=Microlunatus sp. GCM10028923 TaxID=3273400 RepID=UPI00361F5446
MTGPERFAAVVVGAGPAGLTGAVRLAAAGLRTALVDAAPRPGGQFWRHTEAAGTRGQHDRSALRRLLRDLAAHRKAGLIDYRPGREVYLITGAPGERRLELRPTAPGGPPTADDGPEGESVIAERLLLCPGGHDRQLPLPGWDLPGVVAAGGAQALLKGQRTLVGRRVLVAGTGPFLLPVAVGLARGGATVVGICEANDPGRWVRSAAAVARVPGKLLEGAGYLAGLARQRIPYRSRTIVGEIRADDRVRSVRLDRLDRAGNRVRTGIAELEVDTVALGWGFTPSLELIMMVGAATGLGVDGSLITEVDAGQRTSQPDVYVAGEACGVGGAALARLEGELAARSLLGESPTEDKIIRRIGRLRAFAEAMHRAHPVPAGWPDWCPPDTLLCRCEEVTLAEAERATSDLAARSARQLKLFTRCGMGWCQGRICGPNVARLVRGRDQDHDDVEDLRAMAKRTFAVPVTLGELARLSDPRRPR